MTSSLYDDAFDGSSSPLPTGQRSGRDDPSDQAQDRLRALVGVAHQATARAYAPYSDFAAGAAVRTTNGATVTGVIVENISLGLAMCAERVAMFGAVARGEWPVELALVAPRTGDELTLPCGACLQVALELGGPDTVIIASDGDESTGPLRLGDLLPRGPHRSS